MTDELSRLALLYVACAFSGLGIPIPEDLPLLAAGHLLAGSGGSWLPTLAVATVGVTTRDSLAWLAGRWFGRRLDAPEPGPVVRLLGQQRLLRARAMIARWGSRAVLAGRFFVGFRAPMFFAAGAAHVPFQRFVVWDLLGMVVTVPVTVWLGARFGQTAVDVLTAALPYTRAITLTAVVAAGVWLWRNRQDA